MYNIVGRGKICGVPWHDNGDNQRSWSFGAPQQTFRRSRTYRHIPSGQTASHTQMTRVFRVVMRVFFISKTKSQGLDNLCASHTGKLVSISFPVAAWIGLVTNRAILNWILVTSISIPVISSYLFSIYHSGSSPQLFFAGSCVSERKDLISTSASAGLSCGTVWPAPLTVAIVSPSYSTYLPATCNEFL